MSVRDTQDAGSAAVEKVLGYLNFSSGTPDPQFLANLNRLSELTAAAQPAAPVWQSVGRILRERLAEKCTTSPTFRDAEQAGAVLGLVFDQALLAYREFHRDLLFHHTDESLFRPFFVGRVCEAVLKQGPPWNE